MTQNVEVAGFKMSRICVVSFEWEMEKERSVGDKEGGAGSRNSREHSHR